MTKNPFRIDRHGRFALKAFRRLFSAVGRRYSPDITAQPDWMYKTSWSAQQQEAYKQWFVRQAMRDLHWGKRKAIVEAGWFLLFYGWRTENPYAASVGRSKAGRKSRKSLSKAHGEQSKT